MTKAEFDWLADQLAERLKTEDESGTIDVEFENDGGIIVFVRGSASVRKCVEYTENHMGIDYSIGGMDIESFNIEEVEVFDSDGIESYMMTEDEIVELEKAVM